MKILLSVPVSLLLQQQTIMKVASFQVSSVSRHHFGVPQFPYNNEASISPSLFANNHPQQQQQRVVSLFMTTTDTEHDLNSKDPFIVLGLNSNDPSCLDKKVIKRAYKRLALKYHPDVATHPNSTDEERRQASENFGKINAAYQTLLQGKGRGSSSASSSSSTSEGGWTPPHRRSQSYTSSSSNSYGGSGGDSSWEDLFSGKYTKQQDEMYDAGDDSFGSIFADLMAGAAGAAAGYSSSSRGGGGVFQDFVEFLERNVDGYGGFDGSGSSRGGNDGELEFLLQTGSVKEVGDEVDDTELVVQQLSTKLQDLEQEILNINADLAGGGLKFSEKIALQERQSECQARKKVVEQYLKQARKRLLALQTRYKQLIVGGANDEKVGGGGRSTRRNTNSSGQTGSTASSSYPSSSSSSTRSTDPDEAWKTEGFGSSGRGRGSGRRRVPRSTANTDSSSYTSTNASSGGTNMGAPSSSSGGTGGYQQSSSSSATRQQPTPYSSPSTSSSNEYIPPHRRASNYAKQVEDDKKRLRDLQVDDEFEKLKKELGL